jgi:hypothetical protein
MSYDVSFYSGPQTPCHACGHSAIEGGKELASFNHTSNTAQMWRDAGCDLAAFHGKLASELAPVLLKTIQTIEEDPESYLQYEPSNGWGSLESTLHFLSNIYKACLYNLDAVLYVCC